MGSGVFGGRRRRVPGERYSAQEIIARASWGSMLAVFVSVLTGSGVLYLGGKSHTIPSVLFAGGVAVLIHGLSWGASILGRIWANSTSAVMLVGYVGKLGIILLAFILVYQLNVLVPRTVALTLACCILIGLVVSSLVIMRNDGPEIGSWD